MDSNTTWNDGFHSDPNPILDDPAMKAAAERLAARIAILNARHRRERND